MSSLNDSVVIKNITHVVKRKYIPTSNCWRENWKGLIFLLFATYVKIEMIRKERGRSRWVLINTQARKYERNGKINSFLFLHTVRANFLTRQKLIWAPLKKYDYGTLHNYVRSPTSRWIWGFFILFFSPRDTNM